MKRRLRLSFWLAIGIVAVAGLWSCTDKEQEEVRQFVSNFAIAVQQGDRSAVLQAYPDAEKADSLSLAFNPDSLQIRRGEDGKSFVVNIGDIAMTIARNDDGAMQITQSQGLFAYPAEQIAFAKKRGNGKPI